ncbi:hypothetical protein SDJN03_20822, partial [Cucurbita argyrosperma subsp. sororia]
MKLNNRSKPSQPTSATVGLAQYGRVAMALCGADGGEAITPTERTAKENKRTTGDAVDRRWNEEEPRRCRRRRTSEETTGVRQPGRWVGERCKRQGSKRFREK